MATFPDIAIKRGTTFPGARLNAKDLGGNAVALAGWTAYAQVRKSADSDDVVFDLSPTIAADDADGLITIPAIAWADTKGVSQGSYVWDLIIEKDGERHELIEKSAFRIGNIVTDPEDN